MKSGISTKLIKQIRDALSAEPKVLSAYVLGSFAANTATTKSDFDIAIYTQDRSLNFKVVYGLLSNISFPGNLDISIINKSSSPLFAFQVIKNGLKVYSRDESVVGDFEAYTLTNYYDTAHLRSIYNSYLEDKFSNHDR